MNTLAKAALTYSSLALSAAFFSGCATTHQLSSDPLSAPTPSTSSIRVKALERLRAGGPTIAADFADYAATFLIENQQPEFPPDLRTFDLAYSAFGKAWEGNIAELQRAVSAQSQGRLNLIRLRPDQVDIEVKGPAAYLRMLEGDKAVMTFTFGPYDPPFSIIR
ncbi:MAG: hypothetical protein K1X83_12510 [Oligoflexia bacterium]|nr:hypothetical protein [Oligoflexia bacterium]